MRVVKEYGHKNGGVIADWQCQFCEQIVYTKTNANDIPDHFRMGNCYRCVQLSEWAWKKAQEIHAKFPYKGTNGVYGLSDDLRKLNTLGQSPTQYFRCYQKRLIRNGISESDFIFTEPTKKALTDSM